MTRLSFGVALAVVLAVALGSATLRAHPLGPLTNQQLAQARAGTAQYHDLSKALAAGYVPVGLVEGEGVYEFVNFSLVDCTFDPSHPEGLAYVPSGDGMRLVGVEFAIPWACTAPGVPPQGFAGDDDIWSQEQDLPIWRLGAMVWAGSRQGPFDPADEGGATH